MWLLDVVLRCLKLLIVTTESELRSRWSWSASTSCLMPKEDSPQPGNPNSFWAALMSWSFKGGLRLWGLHQVTCWQEEEAQQQLGGRDEDQGERRRGCDVSVEPRRATSTRPGAGVKPATRPSIFSWGLFGLCPALVCSSRCSSGPIRDVVPACFVTHWQHLSSKPVIPISPRRKRSSNNSSTNEDLRASFSPTGVLICCMYSQQTGTKKLYRFSRIGKNLMYEGGRVW